MKTRNFYLLSFTIGFVIGGVTFLARHVLPNSLDTFVNSGAMWVVVAFVIGTKSKSARCGVLAGIIAVSAELVGYYTFRYIVTASPVWLSETAWIPFAIIGGSSMGYFGYAYRNSLGFRQKISSVALGSVFVGEGLLLYQAASREVIGTLWILVGILLTFMLTRRIQQRNGVLVLLSLGLGTLFFFGYHLLSR